VSRTALQRVVDEAFPRKEIPDDVGDVTDNAPVEVVLDLGMGDEEAVKLVVALRAARVLGQGVAGLVVLPKQREKGLYAHALFTGRIAFEKFRATYDVTGKFVATSVKGWPLFAQNVEGGRAHMFSGIGDAEELSDVKPPPPRVEEPPTRVDALVEPRAPSRLSAMIDRVRSFFA